MLMSLSLVITVVVYREQLKSDCKEKGNRYFMCMV